MSRRNVPGTIYLIHFIRPYKHAMHYMGWTEDLETRLADHQAGRGSRLMAVIKAAGIDWKLTRTWKGDRYRERQLKNQGGSKRRCPECGVKPRKDKNMETTFTAKATAQEAAELQDTLEHGYKKAYDAAHDAGPWASDYESRFQTAVECNEVAADVVHETLENGMRHPGEPTADFLARTKAEAQKAQAKQAGFQTADQIIRAQADAGMTPEMIDQHQEEIAASLLSDAKTADEQAFAREYADTADIYRRDLKEMDEPNPAPGTPHPDATLAAQGWHVCDHGIYTRHPDGQLQPEREAC